MQKKEGARKTNKMFIFFVFTINQNIEFDHYFEPQNTVPNTILGIQIGLRFNHRSLLNFNFEKYFILFESAWKVCL